MKNPLDILIICNKSPWPALEGGPMAMNNLIEGLIHTGHRVKVLSLNTNKYSVDVSKIPVTYREKTQIELVYIDLSIKPLHAFANLFTKKSYHVERFKSRAFEKKLIEILNAGHFDIVQIELVYMSPYLETIRKHSQAKIVLRAHNIEHLIWERIETGEKNPIKKFYLHHLSTTLKNYELNILDQYDGIVPITNKDADFFRNNTKVPVCTISFGIDLAESKSHPPSEIENALYHIGAMNWIPNEEGIKWFLEEVWPLVISREKSLKVYLAGREMPAWLINLKMENVEVVGEVPSAIDFINSKSISIAPLLSGSGIRIKILESMAMGKAVIATSVGAEGIHYKHDTNIIIADTAEAFANEAIRLYRNPDLSAKIGENAKVLIGNDHKTSKIIDRLVSFYREIL